MKKQIVLVGVMFAMTIASFAAKTNVVLTLHRTDHGNSHTQVNRAPMRLPIEVISDTDLQTVYVNGDDSLMTRFLQSNYFSIRRALTLLV